MMSEKPKELTAKERVFVEEYCVCLNAAAAARTAKYSDKTARFIGAENLTKPHIQQAIEQHLNEEAMSRKEVLHRLTQHARGSLEPFLVDDEKTKRRYLNLYTDDAKANVNLLKKVETEVTTRKGEDDEPEVLTVWTKVEIHDPQAALVHLGRAHKLFTDKQEVTGKDGGPIELTDTERTKRLVALLVAARARRDAESSQGGSGDGG